MSTSHTLNVLVSTGTAFAVAHGGVSVSVLRSAAKGDGPTGSVVFTSVDNTLLVFGEQLSVDGTISVSDGGCAAAVTDASNISCLVCDEDVSTNTNGLECRVGEIDDYTATDHALCVECAEGFFITLVGCQACAANTVPTRRRP